MFNLRPSRYIAKCLPPPVGGSHPATLNRRTNSRHLIGFGILPCVQIDPINHRELVTVLDAKKNPALQRATQILAALFERIAVPPASFARRDVSPKASILHDLVMRVSQCCLDVICKHAWKDTPMLPTW